MSSYSCINNTGCRYDLQGACLLRCQDSLDASLYNSRTVPQKKDLVNHPPHYTTSSIECIDAIEAALGKEGFISYLRGNIMKYTWRGPHKNQIEDYKKAEWYIKRLIFTMEKE